MNDSERIVSLLDGADAFLRNRVISEPLLLNEYDIEVLLDIARVCDEAANLIIRQNEQLDKLRIRDERWHSLLGFGE